MPLLNPSIPFTEAKSEESSKFILDLGLKVPDVLTQVCIHLYSYPQLALL